VRHSLPCRYSYSSHPKHEVLHSVTPLRWLFTRASIDAKQPALSKQPTSNTVLRWVGPADCGSVFLFPYCACVVVGCGPTSIQCSKREGGQEKKHRRQHGESTLRSAQSPQRATVRRKAKAKPSTPNQHEPKQAKCLTSKHSTRSWNHNHLRWNSTAQTEGRSSQRTGVYS
jgi:hypothetical protein